MSELNTVGFHQPPEGNYIEVLATVEFPRQLKFATSVCRGNQNFESIDLARFWWLVVIRNVGTERSGGDTERMKHKSPPQRMAFV